MNCFAKITIDGRTAQDLLNATFEQVEDMIDKLKAAKIVEAYILTRRELDVLAASADAARDYLYTLMKLIEAMAEAAKKIEAEKKGGEA